MTTWKLNEVFGSEEDRTKEVIDILVRDVQNLSGKQEDDTKRSMRKMAKESKTRKRCAMI